jgi:hypothetical protein
VELTAEAMHGAVGATSAVGVGVGVRVSGS